MFEILNISRMVDFIALKMLTHSLTKNPIRKEKGLFAFGRKTKLKVFSEIVLVDTMKTFALMNLFVLPTMFMTQEMY